MTCKSTRPTCPDSNPQHSDVGTSARDRAPVPSSTGLWFSATPERTWEHVLQSCFPNSTQNKVRLLATNLSFLEQVHTEARGSSLGGGIRHAQRLHDADSREAYSEHGGNHSQSVAAMAMLRQTVQGLTPDELQLTAEQFHGLRIYLNQKINDLAPYYTQMGNINLLAGEGHRAWKRTCNVTSLSMALEGLGVSPSNFTGDKRLLERIVTALEPWRLSQQVEEDKRAAKAKAAALSKHKGKRRGPVNMPEDDDWGVCYSRLDDLRMPDFVQYAAVYLAFTEPPGRGKKKGSTGRLAPEKAFLVDVLAARRMAAGMVLSSDTLAKLATEFGLPKPQTGSIENYGTVNRDLKDWHSKEEAFVQNQMAAFQKETKQKLVPGSSAEQEELNKIRESSNFKDITNHEQKDRDKLALLKKNWGPNVLAYRNRVMKEVLPKTDGGAQVVINRPGHFMKLHSIDPDGLVMDDPWVEGKQHLVPWSDAYEQGYFRAFIILTK